MNPRIILNLCSSVCLCWGMEMEYSHNGMALRWVGDWMCGRKRILRSCDEWLVVSRIKFVHLLSFQNKHKNEQTMNERGMIKWNKMKIDLF